jgi:hypothetical protein
VLLQFRAFLARFDGPSPGQGGSHLAAFLCSVCVQRVCAASAVQRVFRVCAAWAACAVVRCGRETAGVWGCESKLL